MEETEENKRTLRQNAALHKLFTDIANHCVSVGIDQKATTANLGAYETPVTPQFVKEVWRILMKATTGKTSTKDMTKAEIDQVYEVFNKFWSELTGEHFAFPSMEMMTLGE